MLLTKCPLAALHNEIPFAFTEIHKGYKISSKFIRSKRKRILEKITLFLWEAMSNNERYASLWFKQAKFDLDAAKSSKENGNYEWTCFQCQQSAEKALKAFLFFNRKRNIITHSIRRLIEQCGIFDRNFFDIRKTKALDQYYIPTRYPNGLPDEIPHEFYTEEDAELCVEYAQMVIQLIQAKLKNL